MNGGKVEAREILASWDDAELGAIELQRRVVRLPSVRGESALQCARTWVDYAAIAMGRKSDTEAFGVLVCEAAALKARDGDAVARRQIGLMLWQFRRGCKP